jgi:hypothetical protein
MNPKTRLGLAFLLALGIATFSGASVAVANNDHHDFAVGAGVHADADALIDLAEVLRIAARFGQAADAAGEALALYEQKGIVPSASHA